MPEVSVVLNAPFSSLYMKYASMLSSLLHISIAFSTPITMNAVA